MPSTTFTSLGELKKPSKNKTSFDGTMIFVLDIDLTNKMNYQLPLIFTVVLHFA